MKPPVSKKWLLKETHGAHALPPDVPPPLVPVLLGRGIDTAEKLRLFLHPPHNLPYDPLRLAGMDLAVQRLYRAVERRETVGVFGDFDVDGVTGTAIIVEGLRAFGVPVLPYLPHRVNEGHGLSNAAVEQLSKQGVSLIVTVDCGVTSVDEVSRARELGADVIITDHHIPGSTLPEAAAIINPRIAGSSYPYLHLSGAGLAFKLIQGLCQFYGQPWSTSLLELAAMGTIADLVPLTDENRYLVREGLASLAETKRPGLLALYRNGRIEPKSINAETVGYQIAPRLNSAGRMGHAGDSLALLTTDSDAEAEALAAKLETLNLERRVLSEQSYQAAVDHLSQIRRLPAILIVDHPCFTPGIAGLVAGRLLDTYNRPAIALAAGEGDRLTASARSLPEFNIVEALSQCEDLFERYGGHAQAAGFTLQRCNLPPLVERMIALAEKARIGQDLGAVMPVDAEVQLPELNDAVLAWLADLEPWGVGNPAPTFLSRGVHVMEAHYMGNQGQHLRLRVRQGKSEWTALAFNLGENWVQGTTSLDLVYTVNKDSWRGEERHVLHVADFRACI